jgi:outer membrane lipoprotein-sorting protein
MRLDTVALCTLLCTLLFAPLGVARAQTVESLLAKYVIARGGSARIAAVHTQRTTEHIKIGQTEGAVTIDQARTALMRMDIVIERGHYARGYDESRAWQALIADTGGVEILNETDTRNLAIESDFDGPLVDPAASGNDVALAGRAMVDGRNSYKIQVTLNGGGGYVDYYYLDPVTYLPVVWEGTRLVNGKMVTFTTHFREYRKFGGLQFPVTIETTTAGTSPQMTTIDNIEINPTLDANEFHPPVFADRN